MIEAIVVAALIGLDQLAKHLTDLYLMPLGSSHPIWENVLHFTSAHNTGAAFSMLAGGRWIFIAVTVLACALILFLLIRKRRKLHLLFRIALSVILAGAIGNLIDRAALGYVRDMIDFRLIQFAIFNVADSCVTIGAAILFLDILFGKGRQLFAQNPAEEKPGPFKAEPAHTPHPDGCADDAATKTNGEISGDTRGTD